VIGRGTIILTSAYILAGGMSRRFGADKALYDFQGQPLIRYPLALLSRHFSTVYIIAKDPAKYASLGYPVIPDISPAQTPLVGIRTGLEHSPADWNCFIACDLPFLTDQVITRLSEAVDHRAPQGVRAVVAETPGGLQPLTACYHRELADSLAAEGQENHSVKDWIRKLDAAFVFFQEEAPFRNINRKEDLDGIPAD